MVKQVRRRLTYANVAATIALFGVLAGGGAYAASQIGPKDIAKNAVRAKHVKRNQIAAKHLKSDAVRTPKIQDGAVTGAKLAEGVAISGPQGPAGPQGTKGDKGDQGAPGVPGEPATRLFASVTAGGNVSFGQGVEDADLTTAGTYTVTFDRDLTGCVAIGNVGWGIPNTGAPVDHRTTVATSISLPDKDQVDILIYNTFVEVLQSNAFLVTVLC